MPTDWTMEMTGKMAEFNVMSKEIRVLHVGPGFRQRGGVASVLRELRAAQSLFSENSIQIEFFETRGFKGWKNKLLFFLADIPRFSWRVVNGINLVHLHVSPRGSMLRKWILYKVARCFRIATIFHWHSDNLALSVDHANPLLKRSFRKFIEASDEAIGVSTEIAGDIRALRKTATVRVIGNSALNAERIARCGPARFISERANDPYIAFSGRFVDEKGIADLFAAVAILKNKARPVRLKLAGTGETYKWRRLAHDIGIEDCISFSGWLQDVEFMDFYRNAWMFCLPSHREPFGIATLEAMLCGLAVVGTKSGGFLDLVKHGQTGYLVDPRNAEQLAMAIEAVMDDPELSWKMGEAGRQYGLERYSFKRVCEDYIKCYRELQRRK